jgi:hypothetical protein
LFDDPEATRAGPGGRESAGGSRKVAVRRDELAGWISGDVDASRGENGAEELSAAVFSIPEAYADMVDGPGLVLLLRLSLAEEEGGPPTRKGPGLDARAEGASEVNAGRGTRGVGGDFGVLSPPARRRHPHRHPHVLPARPPTKY